MFEDLLVVDDVLVIGTATVRTGLYDFPFREFLPTRSVYRTLERPLDGIVRVGPLVNYGAWVAALEEYGVNTLNDETAHRRASELSTWYPHLRGMTPRSKVYVELPSARDVAKEFDWPVFVKGDRQTSRHSKAKSVIESAAQFDALVGQVWRADPILRWQKLVVREFVPLRRVGGGRPTEIRPSFEFRAFVWRGEVAGIGRYWQDAASYSLTPEERDACVKLVKEAAVALNVPFVVVDVAMTADGAWIVIEVNDGQESGYAGVVPLQLWQQIVDFERDYVMKTSG